MSTSQKVCDEWYITGSNGSWSDVIVTRDTGSGNQSITIEAKLASVSDTADYVYLKLFQKFWIVPNQLYTICGKCTYKSDNILIVYPQASGTTTIYLSTENVYIVSLAHAASEYSFGFLARVPLTTEIGTLNGILEIDTAKDEANIAVNSGEQS